MGIEYGDGCSVGRPRGEESSCVSERVVQSTYGIVVGVGRDKLCCDGMQGGAVEGRQIHVEVEGGSNDAIREDGWRSYSPGKCGKCGNGKSKVGKCCRRERESEPKNESVLGVRGCKGIAGFGWR